MKRRDFLQSLALAAAAGLRSDANAGTLSSHSQLSHSTGSGQRKTEQFRASDRVRSGMALGGIGAGSVELRKDGRFYNWSIFNNLPRGTGPVFRLADADPEDPNASVLFFKVRYQVEDQEPQIRLLQLPNGLNEGGIGSITYLFPWMQAVEEIEYSARFPFVRLTYSDADMPFEIALEAWSSFIPHDVKHSSLPQIFFDFTLQSKTTRHVDVMLIMSARNTVGYDTPERYFTTSIEARGEHTTVVMSCNGMDKTSSTWGEIALTAIDQDPTYYAGWSHLHPYYEYVIRNKQLPNLDDTDGKASLRTIPDWMPATTGRNVFDERTGRKGIRKRPDEPEARLYSSLAYSFVLPRRSKIQRSFAFSWNFPNLHSEDIDHAETKTIDGNYYSNFFTNALELAHYCASNRKILRERTEQFQKDFFDSSIEVDVLEQVNSHLNTFFTSGCLTRDGSFGILEGLTSTQPWGPIATMDVMLYGTAPIIALFPELQKATMRSHAKVQSKTGEVAHGLLKSFRSGEDGTAGVSHRLDLPGQFVILTLRDYFWTGDRAYLDEMYPHVQRAIDYIAHHRAFAGDSIPIMRGIECSYDNFPMYGYASYLVSQWACALVSAIEAAEAMGDNTASSRYGSMLATTQKVLETQLWNGHYYRLYNDKANTGGRGDISEGLLSDQMIGQWLAHHSALDSILPKEHIEAAMHSILRENFRPDYGLKNCSWPGDSFLSPVSRDIWVDQANTCWSGVELAFASHLLYEGYREEALEVIRTVEQRYRKNGLYWDHQEFGGHYFRPMSSWSIVNGYLGLGIHAGRLRFAPRIHAASYKLFFATPSATAHFIAKSGMIRLRCLTGSLEFQQIEIEGSHNLTPSLRNTGLEHSRTNSTGRYTLFTFPSSVALKDGEEVVFS